MHFSMPGKSLLTSGRKLHAVDGVDLQIAPGDSIGLVGESGCGKSTFARMVARLLDPTEGKIFLRGQEISQMTAAEFAASPARRKIQMVFQDPSGSLNPRFTVFDLIADPVRVLTPPASREELRQIVGNAAQAVNLPPALLERLPHQLSAGQKARVGIARALAVRPQLLVLDEPVSALDVSVQVTILQLLDRLRRQYGIALLFVSHDLNVVRLLCSHIMVMYLGQVVESGNLRQIYNAPAHPYTRALLSAIPSLHKDQTDKRIRLDGEPQSPIEPPATICRFTGRCPIERPQCSLVMPELRPLPDGRLVRCHFAEEK